MHFTEIYFLIKNAIYIAVNNRVDTTNKNNDIAALKNVMKNFTAEIIEETTTETANEFLGQHDGFRGCIRSF